MYQGRDIHCSVQGVAVCDVLEGQGVHAYLAHLYTVLMICETVKDFV